MDLGVLEGQTKGGYFSDFIFDPSVNQCNGHGWYTGYIQPGYTTYTVLVMINVNRKVSCDM